MEKINIEEPEKETNISVFKPSPVLDSAILKMLENPQIFQNFLKIFNIRPNLPSKATAPPPPIKKINKTSRNNRSTSDLSPPIVEKISIPSYVEQNIKRILTPTWDSAENDFSSHLPSEYIKTPTSEFITMHQSMEMLESRMFLDQNTKYYHSGQLLDIAEYNPPKPMNDIERKKAERYSVVEIPKKIPNTWPQRPWDKPDMIMNDFETRDLEQKILENSILSMDPANWSLTSRKKRTRHISRQDSDTQRSGRRRKTIVTLSTLSYATDCEDEETDWSDFDF